MAPLCFILRAFLQSVRNSRLIAQKYSVWPLVRCHSAQPNLYLNTAIKI